VIRPRILLVPTATELEWSIRPLLEDWAEVAYYDAPGVGSEPPVADLTPRAVAQRGLEELERRRWERCVVVGDEMGAAHAVMVAGMAGPRVAGLALGHPVLSFRAEGEAPSIHPEVFSGFVRLAETDYGTYVRALTQVTQGAYDDQMADRYRERVPEAVARGLLPQMTRLLEEWNPAPTLTALRDAGVPLLLAEHAGCLMWTREGYEEVVAALPGATTASTEVKPSASPEFAEALREFCAGLG